MIKLTFMTLATAGLLSFCDTSEERAEGHFQAGLDLLEQGDVDRALVEFRNVFKLEGTHQEARLRYAEAERARGNIRQAYGQYLRLVEQYPDNLPGQRALAELSLQTNNWDAARRYGSAAAELAPDDLLVQAVNVTVAYRDALSGSGDVVAVQDAVTKAQALISEDPNLMIAQRVVIDDLIRNQDWTAALSAIDAALVVAVEDKELYTTRLGVLSQLGETREIRAQLEEMIERYPDDPNVAATLVRWHLSQGDIDAAQAFLEARADEDPREIDDIVTYIRFLAEVRDQETALTELERILEGDPPAVERLTALRAGFRFDLGERDGAIAEMESLVDGMEPSDERRSIMMMQAQMLDVTGNNVGARALVEEVLEEDARQTEALKMRASWLIESDRTDEAITALRTVLGDTPSDVAAMTLMARAHERAGNRDLMADMLGRAVEASNNSPDESLRYARHLIAEDNLRTAETVLINALRLAQGNVALLDALGDVYQSEQDWARLDQVIDTLRDQEGATAERSANELTARQLAAQKREDELITFLDTLADDRTDDLGAAAMILRNRLAQGDVEGARQYAREMLEANPNDPNRRFLMASVQTVTGEIDAAETTFRELAAQTPQAQGLWLSLYNVYLAQGNAAAARQAVLDGIEASPDSSQLNWALAGILEREGDLAGAIEIYEKLYAADSSNLIIANNLASLLSVGREDADSLSRAHEIARRLRDRDVPAFQDTYGWIAFRRGDLDTALSALEPAAAGLPNDPRVQYHLARAYAARGQDSEALAQYRKVAELAAGSTGGTLSDLMAEVDAEIERLVASAEASDTQD